MKLPAANYPAIAFVLVSTFGLGAVVGRSTAPVAAVVIADPPERAKQQPAAVKPDTRESLALKLMATGTSRDWVAASADTKALLAVYYAARYTSPDENVTTFARSKTIIEYLEEMSIQELDRKENSPLREHLAIYFALHEGIKKENAKAGKR